MKTFVLYDDHRPNADGTRIHLSGLHLERFKKNPVMLYMHYRAATPQEKPDGSEVIGRWNNIRIQDNQLLAEAVFDENDAFAQKIARKVADGFLKGASIGIEVHRSSEAKQDKLPGQKSSTIVESTLLEASIVDIPQNENALNHCALYQNFSYSEPKNAEKSTPPLLHTLQEMLQLKENSGEKELLLHLQQTLATHQALSEWKATFLGKQSERILAEGLAEGLITPQNYTQYASELTQDFEETEAKINTLRQEAQALKQKRAQLSHFLHPIQAPVPHGAAEHVSSPETGDSVYHQLLKCEPMKLKTLQQQDPVAFRQLLEAHLAWKITQLDARRGAPQAYA